MDPKMNPDLKASIRKSISAIRRAKSVLIAAHVNPDGDTLGCMTALGLALLPSGKKVTLACQDGVPTRFQFLPASELVLSQISETADVAIAVDCGSIKQLGTIGRMFSKARTTIQIDHHDFGDAFGKIQILEHDASAVGEIIYEMIRALKVEITPAIATCLLTSIVIDTGSFRFSNIRPKTFQICSKLIQKGVDLPHLIEEAYWTRNRPTAQLTGHCLLNAAYSTDGRLAWGVVTQKDIKRFEAKLSDADAIADELRTIDGVTIAALFRETERRTFRVSLRSRHGVNVAAVAKLFGGGGHHNSAGCSIKNSDEERDRLLHELQALLV
jgi:phosphoesterase RecJ-like protein